MKKKLKLKTKYNRVTLSSAFGIRLAYLDQVNDLIDDLQEIKTESLRDKGNSSFKLEIVKKCKDKIENLELIEDLSLETSLKLLDLRTRKAIHN